MYTNNMKTVTRTRMSAGERREEILDAAVTEFAVKGLHGTSTEAIAQRAGISQPYLFRLYGTKKDLFLAAVERGFDRVRDAFEVAVQSNPQAPLPAMGAAYRRLLTHREELLLQMQSYVACSDPEVRTVVRDRFAQLYRSVEELSGESEEHVRLFFAQGMLLNVAAAMDLPALTDTESWAGRCLGQKL
ncbi:MAG: TetR family transcriptional regulator [Chloroflexota bacterium]